jgi:putative membrane protein
MIKGEVTDPTDGLLGPRVIIEEYPPESERNAVFKLLAPQVIHTSQTGRIVAAPAVEPHPVAAGKSKTRRRGVMKFALAALGTAFVGWLGIDLYLWIRSAFDVSGGLGSTAIIAATLGIVGAGALIGHEMRSYFALKNVETNQRRLMGLSRDVRPSEIREAIQDVMAEIPMNGETKAALEAFQRQLQPHHSPAQQVEIFSRTVMTPLDRRAEIVVRRATARAFGITAISPTALIDAAFFIACSIRMVRKIAACYGHRPTALATAYLLRRLVTEAGKLGAVDLAGATLTQHIGGAIAERVATSAAEALYAAQRMARLGLVTMGMCRPLPFRQDELPTLMSALMGNLFAQPPEDSDES